MIEGWLKEKWLFDRKFVLGTFLQFYDTAGVEILANAGFDFVVIDLEHGTFSSETIKTLVITSDLSGIVPIVRVKENSGQLILGPLEAGALGVQIPFVCNAEDVKNGITPPITRFLYHIHLISSTGKSFTATWLCRCFPWCVTVLTSL